MLRLFIDGSEIDTGKTGFSLPVSYKINSYNDFGSASGNSSVKVKIPRTINNRRVLGEAVIGQKNFNDYNEHEAELFNNEVLVFKGLANVLKRTSNGYEIQLYNENSSWFSSIKSKSIRGVDLGEFVFTKDHVQNSFDNSPSNAKLDKRDYTYPLIDYSNLLGKTGCTSDIKAGEMRPAIFTKSIVRKIFNDAGYKFKTFGIFDAILEKRIEPYTSNNLESDDVFLENETIELSTVSGTQVDFLPNPQVFSIRNLFDDFTRVVEDKDEEDRYDTALGRYKIKWKGRYRIEMSYDMIIKKFVTVNDTFDMEFRVDLRTADGVFIRRLDSTIVQGTTGILKTFSAEGNSIFDFVIPESQRGNYISVRVTNQVGAKDTLESITFNKLTFNLIPTRIPFQIDMEFVMSSSLEDFKQSIYLKNLARQYNLIFITNDVKKEVTVITSDEFYKSSAFSEDWSEKINLEKGYEVRKLRKIKKQIDFKYKADENDKWIDLNGEDLDFAWNFEKQNDDQFLDGTENLELIWGWTGMELTELNDVDALVIPQMIDKVARKQQEESLRRLADTAEELVNQLADPDKTPEERADIVNDLKANSAERADLLEGNYNLTPRCFYYSGLQAGKWKFENQNLTIYPRAFSYDSADESALNMAYGDLSLTNSKGLIDRHWINSLKRINAEQLVGRFDLEEIDIESLDFSTPKRVRLDDGNDYILILDNIEDFKHGKRSPTRCEFLQLKPL